ncbi:MAG: hypothetical protein HFJ19_04060 [Clostridia bacterium]|nr:hypothetical protein [Clostridia bacterium]
MKGLRNIVYQSSKVIVQQLQKGSNNIAVIVSNGYLFTVDESNHITFSSEYKKIRGYKDSTVFAVFYTQTYEGTDVADRELAELINKDFMLYKKIILHGYSECGLRFLSLYHECLDTWSKLRTHVVSVSASINRICLEDILTDRSEYGHGYKSHIHIVVSKTPTNQLNLILQVIRTCETVPLEEQIPDGIYDQITASSKDSAMHKSCALVRSLM